MTTIYFTYYSEYQNFVDKMFFFNLHECRQEIFYQKNLRDINIIAAIHVSLVGVELRAFGFDRSPRSPNVCMSIESLANSQGPRADTIFYTVKIVSALGPLLNSLMCLHELLEVRGLHGYMVYMNYMIYIKHGLQNLLKSQPLVYKTCS